MEHDEPGSVRTVNPVVFFLITGLGALGLLALGYALLAVLMKLGVGK